MNYAELIRDIRSKHVGTADEHALLKGLADDWTEAEQKAREVLEDDIRTRTEYLDEREAELAERGYGRPLDDAVFGFLKTRDEWDRTNLAESCIARGLTSKDLHDIADIVFALETEQKDQTGDHK